MLRQPKFDLGLEEPSWNHHSLEVGPLKVSNPQHDLQTTILNAFSKPPSQMWERHLPPSNTSCKIKQTIVGRQPLASASIILGGLPCSLVRALHQGNVDCIGIDLSDFFCGIGLVDSWRRCFELASVQVLRNTLTLHAGQVGVGSIN